MTTIAQKHSLASARADWVGTRLVIGWSCTRRAAEPGMNALERVDFVVSVQPLDHEFVVIEAWLESHGVRTRTVHAPTRRRCITLQSCGMQHLDALDDDGTPVLSCSLAVNADHTRLLFAKTTLLIEAGFAAGAHDVPRLV